MPDRTRQPTTETGPLLHVVRGGCEAPAGGGECVVSRGAVRAGDRHEPWTVRVTDAVRALARAADASAVDFELAARVGVEWALVCEDLRQVAVDPAALDRPAAVERVTGELDAAAAAYLRRLTAWGGGDDGAAPRFGGADAAAGAGAGAGSPAAGELVTVGLPARLSARLLRADLDALLAAVELERALAWEVAALLTGRTMSEWAPLTALALTR